MYVPGTHLIDRIDTTTFLYKNGTTCMMCYDSVVASLCWTNEFQLTSSVGIQRIKTT